MCGRVTLIDPSRVFGEFSLTRASTDLKVQPRYNIAPSQSVVVVRAQSGEGSTRIELLSWGLVPSWTRDLAGARKPINVRVETLQAKAAFRGMLARRRCLVLTDGFYEWEREGARSRPYHIHRPDRGALTLAGVWDRWVAPDGEVIESCAVVTRPSLHPVREIHDRMPAIIEAHDRGTWLDGTIVDERRLIELLMRGDDSQTAEVDLEMQAVADTVNAASSEGPGCLDPPTGIQMSLFRT